MDYKKKYLNYKLKYLTARKALVGGGDQAPAGIHGDLETYIKVYFQVYLYELDESDNMKVIDDKFKKINEFFEIDISENIYGFIKNHNETIKTNIEGKTELEEKYNFLIQKINEDEKDEKEHDGTNYANNFAKAIDENMFCSIM